MRYELWQWLSVAASIAGWVWCWLREPTLVHAVAALAPFLLWQLWAEHRWRRCRAVVDENGVAWGWRRRPIGWSSLLGARMEGDRLALETHSGTLVLPATITDPGRLLAEVRRRTARPGAPFGAADAGWLLGLLGLRPGYRRQVRTAPGKRERRDFHLGYVYSVATVVTMVLAVRADGPWLAALVGLPLAAWVWRHLLFAKPAANLAWFDDDGIEFDTDRRARLAWHQLVALRDEGDRFTLITTEGDLTIMADGESAAAVRHTAEQVLAALEASGGWVATVGDASLSPAERLVDGEERGLSQVEYGGTGLLAGGSIDHGVPSGQSPAGRPVPP